ECKDPAAALGQLLASPSIASKNWVYRQYDHMVRDGSVVCPGSDAAVIRLKTDSLPNVSGDLKSEISNFKSDKFIVLTVDGNGTYVYLDPYEGGKIVVTEAA